ncbi:MAG: GDP-mannose 4,6-dehydratase [Janthinobacterium lividum]
MARVLVTGITGFTGVYLANLLREKGDEVFGIASNVDDRSRGIHQCDLLDASALRDAVAEIRPEAVVHLAAIAFVAHGDVDAIYRTNVAGTRNLLAALAALDTRPDAVLLASSANIYGNPEIDPLIEEAGYLPANDYAVSKVAMEYMAALWRHRLPITVVRPFNYSGVGQSTQFLLPKIVDHFRRNAPEIELGNLDVARDFSDVRTVVDAYARLLQAGSTAGQAFNVCSGTAHSLQDVIGQMQHIAGYEIEVRVNPAFVRENEVKRLRGSKEKLESRIGPLRPIPLADTLRWMYEAP